MSDKKLWDQYVAMEKERDAYKSAYANWTAKTEWLQDEINSGKLPAKYLGMHRADGIKVEIDALRAKIEAMEKQEPVAWARKLAIGLPSFGCVTDLKYRPSNMPESAYMPLYALPGSAPEPSESEARMRWLLRQIVHALPSRRDWLDPAIEREARIATAPEANHDPR